MAPALSVAMAARLSPSTSLWSMAMGVKQSTSALTAVVASWLPPSPASRMATSTRSSAKASKASTVRNSKYVSAGAASMTLLAWLVHNSCGQGLPSMRMRSVGLTKCGEVYSPVRRPWAAHREARKEAVDPLPLVPSTCTVTKGGRTRPRADRACRMRSRPMSMWKSPRLSRCCSIWVKSLKCCLMGSTVP